MRTRFYISVAVAAITLTAAATFAQPPVSEEDTIAFLGMNGSPGESRKCLEVYVANSVEIAGLMARLEFDPSVLALVVDHIDTSFETVYLEYEIVGRGEDFTGTVIARSNDSGVFVVVFLPDIWGEARLAAGSGPIIRVYFDVLSTVPLGGSLVMPADGEYETNNFGTPEGGSIFPTLVGFDFNVVTLPYVPGDADNSEDVDLSDVNFLVNHLFLNGPVSSPRNSSDANGDCSINIADITYLVEYIFRSGAAPEIGCVECSY